MNINQILLAAAMGEAMPLNFETLPVLESGADATHFVVEAKGGSDADETGVGGGLSGANLVLTRFGTVAATSSDWRAASANGGLAVTDTFLDTFMRNSTGFAMHWHLRDTNAVAGAGAYVFDLAGTSPAAWFLYLLGSTTSVRLAKRMTTKFGGQLLLTPATLTDVLPSSGEFHVLMSVDYTNDLSFVGISIGATQPTKLADFAHYAVSDASQNVPASAVTHAGSENAVIGAVSGGAAVGFKSFTAKLGPSVTLA